MRPADLAGDAVAALLSEMALRARRILEDTERVALFSPATGKPYYSFRGQEQSRPINADLYSDDAAEFEQLLAAFRGGFSGSNPN